MAVEFSDSFNLADYWRFRNCLINGRIDVPAPQWACLRSFDYDESTAVDLSDFAVFQNIFTNKR